jgi:preprotein translocase subunit SecG
MGFLIGLLTLVMVLDCFALVFLILIQLPKKDAGAGLAFGGSATDALFGAGSGNVLTKITKYAATTFFVLAIILGIFQSKFSGRSSSEFQRRLEQTSRSAAGATSPATAPSKPAATPATPLTSTNMLQSTAEAPANAPAATNTAPPK